jgi:hypothetical protein
VRREEAEGTHLLNLGIGLPPTELRPAVRDALADADADADAGGQSRGALLVMEEIPAAVFPLVARRIGHWPGIPFSLITREPAHLDTFHRSGIDRFVAVHTDVEAAERQQTIPIRRWALRAHNRGRA